MNINQSVAHIFGYTVGILFILGSWFDVHGTEVLGIFLCQAALCIACFPAAPYKLSYVIAPSSMCLLWDSGSGCVPFRDKLRLSFWVETYVACG